MYDSKHSDYKITDSECEFHSNQKANIAKSIFEAFRKRGLKIGVYFSKPDWYSPFYWSPYWATPDRHVNYIIEKHPELWESFKRFTYNQIEELMSDYGKIDILWLDGGWVRPNTPNRIDYDSAIQNQDIDMDNIAKMARKHQADLIIVDRWVPGRHENYLTPEQKIPDEVIHEPWESCMTLGESWSHVKNENYKAVTVLIRNLVDIISKGGNFLLNVGPDSLGNLDLEATEKLEEMGKWIKINAEAIYGSRPLAPYKYKNIRFLQKEDSVYAFVFVEDQQASESITIPSDNIPEFQTVSILGSDKEVDWTLDKNNILIQIPEEILGDNLLGKVFLLKFN